jgi:hypothetical protein
LDSSIPAGLSAVIEQSMAKSPEERFQTGAALVTALENYKSFQALNPNTATTINQPSSTVVSSRDTQRIASTVQANASKRHPVRKLLIAAIVLVLLAIAFLALRRQTPKPVESANTAQPVQAPTPPPAPSTATNDETESEVPKPAKSAEVVEKQPSTPGKSIGTINVTSNPPTAAIFLDNKTTGLRTPAQLQLSRGEHTVSVHMDGFEPSSAKFNVRGGEQLEFAPKLKVALPNVPGVNMPAVKIPEIDIKKMTDAELWQSWTKAVEQDGQAWTSEPAILVNTRPSGAHIFVDGNATGKVSPAVIPTPPGGHEVRLELDGYQSAERQVEVKAKRPAMVNIALKPAKSENQ